MNDIVIARIELINVLDEVKTLTHDLTIGELDELIDEVTQLYERYSVYAQSRKHDKI